MKTCRVLLFGLSAFVVCIYPCLAWDSAGHMVIAAGAYRNLSAGTQQRVSEVLKAHPDYEKWERAFGADGAGVDLGLYVFMKASAWPDAIRRKHNQYDHPHWHYIDYRLSPPRFRFEAGPEPENDILVGIEQSEKVLANPGAAAESRAVSMSWLVHLIGDLHQPLHCGSLVNETYPTGDKGGNDFYVKPGKIGIKLHRLWDSMLGTSGTVRTDVNYAIQLASQHPRKRLKELDQAKTPKEWSLETRGVAVAKAYLRGKLAGNTSSENAPELPRSYTRSAKRVAEKQAALASYRLADAVQRCLK